jgi:MFS family permease
LKLYFITYGVTLGIGQSLLLASVLSILPHYFSKRLGLANGLMNFGGALLTISLPFVYSECLKLIGLSYTFYVLAGFSFVSALAAITYQPQLKKNHYTEKWYHRIKNSCGFEVLKKRKFIIWIISAVIGFFGYLIPIMTIVGVFFF